MEGLKAAKMVETVDLLLIHANLVTQDPQRTVIEDGGVAVRNGKIMAIGPSNDLLSHFHSENILRAGGKWAIPGLINNHTHLFQIWMRGLGKDAPFLEWMAKSISRLMPLMDEEAIYLAALTGCLEAIRSGTTTLLDYMYANVRPMLSDCVLQAFEDIGIRGILARGYTDVEKFPFNDFPSRTWEPIDRTLSDVDRLQSHYYDHPRIQIALAPSAIWGMTPGGLISTVEYARRHNLLVTMHLLETPIDDSFCLEKFGLRSLPYLEKIGFLDLPFLGVHMIYSQSEDLGLLDRYQVKISHNPVSNMILGNGICPITELLGRGICIGLGTDGAASNDSQNMLETMKSAALTQKAFTHNAAAISAKMVFSMATDMGANSIGQGEQIGSLEVGKHADFVLIDLDQANTTPSYDFLSSLVYSGSERNISAVIVNGQVLFQEGHFILVDEEGILNKTRQKAKNLITRII